MKRWMWIICGILAFQMLGKTGEDLETLKPVQLLQVEKEQEQIILKTDTGDRVRGNTLRLALEDMQETADGRIFLETADYLLLTEGTEELVPELRKQLRPAVRLCMAEKNGNLKKLAQFLSAHEPGVSLGQYGYGKEKLPVLIMRKGRLKLAGNYG